MEEIYHDAHVFLGAVEQGRVVRALDDIFQRARYVLRQPFLTTAIGASVAAIANIGPGLGAVGAAENYGWMDPASHLILIGLMIVGRLEIFTVLLLFHPDLWRR